MAISAASLAELRRTAQLEGVEEAAAAAARGEIDPTVPDSITYYGTRIERELARLTEHLARTGSSQAVDEASATLDAMLARLRHFGSTRKAGLVSRLFRRNASHGLSAARISEVETELDTLAGRLEGCSNPLLTERLTLERRRDEIVAQLDRLAAYVAGGLAALEDGLDAVAARDLLGRVQELVMGRTVALQGLATLEIMVANRQQLQERSQFVLRHALPLWHQQANLVQRELSGSAQAAKARLEAANAALVDALEDGPDGSSEGA